MRIRASAHVLLYALLGVAVIPVFPHFLSPNEVTRWAFAASVVERGTAEISGVLPILGPAMEDASIKDGRIYSNKAPGVALLALPGYLAARPFVGGPSASSLRPSLTLMRMAAATVPLLLLALVVEGAAIRLGATPARARFAAGALLFATPLFAYGLLLFAHALVAACLFGAWASFFVTGAESSARRDVLGGALVGLAVISEYPAAVPAAILVLCAAAASPRRMLPIAAGGAPFALVLAAYDSLCFGSPFALSSAFEVSGRVRALRMAGLFGIGLPSPGFFLRLLFDPSHGLLVFSPLLLLWPLAFRAARTRTSRAGAAALALVPFSFFVVYAGFPDWHGGFNVGPRYVVPALPFLLFPFAFREGARLEAALTGASVLACVATTLAFPFVPPGFSLPWASFAPFFFERELMVPNALQLVAPWAARVVLPAIVCIAVYFFLEGKRGEKGTSSAAALSLFGGAAVWAILGFFLSKQIFLPSSSLLLQRAYIADVYFERRGALEEEIARTGIPQPRLLARRERELALPPTSWPSGASGR